MIYDYEAKILQHINNACPEVRLATYAKEKTMFNSMAQVTQMPALLFYRVPTDWTCGPCYRVNDGKMSGRYTPVIQPYIGRIYFTQTADILSMASKIKYYLDDNPYVAVPYSEGPIAVALRLQYIKVDEESNVTEKKGPIRFIEMAWSSQLFLDDVDPLRWGLVEQVRIFINEVGELCLDANKLIRIIK